MINSKQADAQLESREWLDLLRCPNDGGELSIRSMAKYDAVSANSTLLDCDVCGRKYVENEGIVRFLDIDSRTKLDHEMKMQEMIARDQGAVSYENTTSPLRFRLEIVPCLKALQPEETDVVVDLGCGTGRVTRRFASLVRRVVAIDYSLASLVQLRNSLPESFRRKVLLVQADICHPPLAAGVFSKAISVQVLEHIPTAEMRRRVMKAAFRLLVPGGTFSCIVYNWSRWKQREAALDRGDNTKKEGFHDTGIYYYNFTSGEFSSLCESSGFTVEYIEGLVIGLRGAHLLGRLVVPINRVLCRRTYGLRNAAYLLAKLHVPTALQGD